MIFMFGIWLLLLAISSCMQYFPMLQTWDYPIDSITNWAVSNVTFTDDSPFEAVKLPVYIFKCG